MNDGISMDYLSKMNITQTIKEHSFVTCNVEAT